MLTRIQRAKEKGEAGFTLIELLVVVAIIGILAAIAIPVFLNQRNSARDASVKADLNSVAKALETGYTVNNAFPISAVELATLQTSQKVSLSPDNRITVKIASGVYTLQGCNAQSGIWYTYKSDAGGMQSVTTGTGACVTSATLVWTP